jgi:CheY-like chemotaxis protein
VQIQVADSGIGMTEELQEKIFQPYFTTKSPGAGCGLGLSTTVRILRGLGALMSLESEPGHGTTFSVYFPVELREAEAAPVIAPSTTNNKLVMLVDDEAEICEMCKSILECFDYRVLTAENGMEALAQVERHPGEISAAVIDMMMPVMDGPATIRALRQAAPSLKIIATSGLSVEEQSRVLGDATPDVYLKKPYSADQLVAALANLHL